MRHSGRGVFEKGAIADAGNLQFELEEFVRVWGRRADAAVDALPLSDCNPDTLGIRILKSGYGIRVSDTPGTRVPVPGTRTNLIIQGLPPYPGTLIIQGPTPSLFSPPPKYFLQL